MPVFNLETLSGMQFRGMQQTKGMSVPQSTFNCQSQPCEWCNSGPRLDAQQCSVHPCAAACPLPDLNGCLSASSCLEARTLLWQCSFLSAC